MRFDDNGLPVWQLWWLYKNDLSKIHLDEFYDLDDLKIYQRELEDRGHEIIQTDT